MDRLPPVLGYQFDNGRYVPIYGQPPGHPAPPPNAPSTPALPPNAMPPQPHHPTNAQQITIDHAMNQMVANAQRNVDRGWAWPGPPPPMIIQTMYVLPPGQVPMQGPPPPIGHAPMAPPPQVSYGRRYVPVRRPPGFQPPPPCLPIPHLHQKPPPDFHPVYPSHILLLKLTLSAEELVANGFVHEVNGTHHVRPLARARGEWLEEGAPTRTCLKCEKEFPKERYSSCHCPPGKFHIWSSTDRLELQKFVKTPQSIGPKDNRNISVLALDTEMIYTSEGLEAARVTVVDHNFKAVFNTFIKPTGKILDLNTRYSGIHPGQVEGGATLEETQLYLNTLINENTILIGHHLANDLKALKMIHSKIVDTAVLFKKNGLYVSLKRLAEQHLGKKIHAGEHDSEEDAKICLQLIAIKFQTLCMMRMGRGGRN